MTTWTAIPDSNLEPGAPARSVDILAIRDNSAAMAERATGAPVVQVPARAYYVTGTGATWTIPDNVTAFTMYITGAGGGGSDGVSPGSAGGNSTCTYNSVTYTGGGGAGSPTIGSGAGGTASGGDANITGQSGAGGGNALSAGFGGGSCGYGGLGGGGAGALCIKRVAVVVGQTTVTYTVGGGGAAGGSPGTAGGAGLIIFEY